MSLYPTEAPKWNPPNVFLVRVTGLEPRGSAPRGPAYALVTGSRGSRGSYPVGLADGEGVTSVTSVTCGLGTSSPSSPATR